MIMEDYTNYYIRTLISLSAALARTGEIFDDLMHSERSTQWTRKGQSLGRYTVFLFLFFLCVSGFVTQETSEMKRVHSPHSLSWEEGQRTSASDYILTDGWMDTSQLGTPTSRCWDCDAFANKQMNSNYQTHRRASRICHATRPMYWKTSKDYIDAVHNK